MFVVLLTVINFKLVMVHLTVFDLIWHLAVVFWKTRQRCRKIRPCCIYHPERYQRPLATDKDKHISFCIWSFMRYFRVICVAYTGWREAQSPTRFCTL